MKKRLQVLYYFILGERVYNFVARAALVSREDRTKLRFRFGHQSFYRFGIRSCLATSHKQILKTPFNMTSSCILGFQQERMSLIILSWFPAGGESL